MLSEAQVYVARDLAKVIRMAALSAAQTPRWGNSITVSSRAFECREGIKPLEVGMVPMLRKPDVEELVRVNFDCDGGPSVPGDLVDAVLRELSPFVIGVGDVVAEHGAEGIKLFRREDRDVDGGSHDGSSFSERDPFPRNGDGFLRPPSLAELGVHPGIMEAAEEIASLAGRDALSQWHLELLLRVVIYAERVISCESRDQP